MTAHTVAEKTHSELGASVASRWMNCPGSINLSRGLPNPTSIFAEEGTAAHALAELALRRGADPQTFVGTTLEGVEVSDEMADFVQVFVDKCRFWIERGHQYHIEQRFNLAAFDPPGPMFGTADFVAYDRVEKALHVYDLKYGQGVVVEAKGNKQLRYYALGAMVANPQWEVSKVFMWIVQPRVSHPDGAVRHDVATLAEMVDFSGELIAAARRTTDPDAPLVAGDWCRFCPAKAVCPAKREQVQALAQIEFATLPTDMPPAPESLPPEVFADILSKLHILEEWATAMRAHAYHKLEQGEDVPGFKLVQKRATRSWENEQVALQVLTGNGDWIEADLTHEPKMKSPAQIEKLLGKKNVPQDLIVKKSSGLKMVPAHHPGEAVSLTAGSEFFPALPSGEEE